MEMALLSKKSNWSLSLLEICLIHALNFLLAPLLLVCGYLFMISAMISYKLSSINSINSSSNPLSCCWLILSHVSLMLSRIFLAAKHLP